MTTKTNEENHPLQGFLNFSKMLKTLKRAILFSVKYEPGRLIALAGMAIITAIIPYLQNGLLGRLIDTTLAFKNSGIGIEAVLYTVGLLLVATAIPNIINLIKSFVSTTFRFNIVRQLDIHFFSKIGTLDIATVESSEYQELSQKTNERGTMTIYHFLDYAIDNLSNLVGVIVSFAILGFIDRTLLIYAFLGSVPALYVQLKYGRDIFYIWELNSSNRRKFFNRRQHFQNVISLTELKLYQLSKRFIGEIKKILDSFDDELKSAERNKLSLELFALVVFIIFLGLGIWRILGLSLSGTIPIGQMLFAYTTYRGFKFTLGEFFRKIGWMSEFSNYSDYWFKLEDLKSKIINKSNAEVVNFEKTPPRIEFKNISFRYNDKKDGDNSGYALENLSFVIEPGEKIAVVGLSGAGKTTLIKLLCRVYDPESGEILINGKNLREINLESWQKQLGVLFQDFTSYQFTVKEVIALGNGEEKINESRVIEAAKMAKADGFIERLPKKYDQLLWKGYEDGVDLSKGEKQRMALARVLYRQSPITILDEPTASVDALAEQEIFETLEKLPGDRTVILISHRFSTVKNANNILVIEHGKLVEEGGHDELIEKNGKYAELYKAQAESYN